MKQKERENQRNTVTRAKTDKGDFLQGGELHIKTNGR